MRRAALVLAAALAAAGCAGPPPPKATPDLEPGVFTLGYAAATPRDADLVRAAQLAVEEINERGGVGGAVRLELVVHEGGGEAGEIARALVLRGVQALVLACDPLAQRAQADVADRTQILAFAPCNEDPTIAERYPVVWPVSLGANAEAAALADYALSQGYASFTPADVWPQLTRYLDVAARARDVAIGGGPTLGTHRSETGTAPPAFTTYGFPTPRSPAARFYSRHAIRYGEEVRSSEVALGYDAIQVVAAAMLGAGTHDTTAIAERLAAGLTVDGALGEIVFPGSGQHQPEVAVAVVRVENGRRVLAEKSLPEDIPPP